MASVTDAQTASITSSAPIEGNISTEHAWTDVVMLDVTSSSKFDKAVADCVADFLVGAGRVDLVKIELKCVPSQTKQSIQIGLSEVGNTQSALVLSMKANGFYFVSNDRTVGTEQLRTLVPEDTISKQLRPQSSMLPSLRIACTKTQDMPTTLTFYLKVHGMRMRYGSLN